MFRLRLLITAILLLGAVVDSTAQARRYVVEKIAVEGNARTEISVIRQNLLLREGQVLDEKLVILSRLKLMNLGLFYQVKTRLKRGSRKGLVILVFKVVERNAVVIEELFIGGSARTPFWGGFGVSDINFLGRGHTLHGAFVLSGDQQAYRLDYFAPSIPGTSLTLGGGLLYTKGLEVFQVLPGPGMTPGTDVSPRVDYERYGGYVSAGFKFGGFNRFLIDYRVEGLRSFVGTGLITPEIARGKSRLFSLSWTFERDTRNRTFVPTRGYHLRFGVELGSEIVGGSYNFSKYKLEWSQTIPIPNGHALRFDLNLGLIQGETPFFNKFFFGDTSFFSFRDRALPRALGVNFSKESIYDDVRFSAGLEYAFRMFGSSAPVNRGYLFFATNATYTSTLAQALGQEDRPLGTAWTFSFDIGVKLDTSVGVFTFSVAYLLDFFL